MSVWYFIGRDYFDTYDYASAQLHACLIMSSYTPDKYDGLGAILTHELDATNYERRLLTGKSTDTDTFPEITYETSMSLTYTGLTGGTGDPEYILIADIANSVPLWLITSDEIEITGATIATIWGELATQDILYDRADWVRLNFADELETDSSTDYGATTTQGLIDTWASRFDQIGALFITNTAGKVGEVSCPDLLPQLYTTWWVNAYDTFIADVATDSGTVYDSTLRNRYHTNRELMKYTAFWIPNVAGKTSVVYGGYPRSELYDDFMSEVSSDSGTVYDTQGYETDLALNTDMFSKVGWICTNTAGKSGVVYGYEYPQQTQTVGTANFEYDATIIGRPNVRAARSVDFESVEITLEETIPAGYEVQLDSGIAPPTNYGAFSELDTIGNADLPYTDSGLTARTNYKYQGRYVVTGNINGSPVTVKGAIGQRQYARGKNQTL